MPSCERCALISSDLLYLISQNLSSSLGKTTFSINSTSTRTLSKTLSDTLYKCNYCLLQYFRTSVILPCQYWKKSVLHTFTDPSRLRRRFCGFWRPAAVRSCRSGKLFPSEVYLLANILHCAFGERDKARLRPNGSPHPRPFYSPSSSPRPPGPCRRVASAIIHHPALFGTSDKFRECWRNYIKHKSIITSLCDRNERCTIDARARLFTSRVPYSRVLHQFHAKTHKSRACTSSQVCLSRTRSPF